MAEKEKKVFELAPLPQKVRLGLIDYDVEQKPSKSISGKQDLQGRARSSKCLIEVASDMLPQRQIETYVHEILHMVYYEAGLDNDPDVHKELNPLCNILTRMLQENDFGWIYREFQKANFAAPVEPAPAPTPGPAPTKA